MRRVGLAAAMRRVNPEGMRRLPPLIVSAAAVAMAAFAAGAAHAKVFLIAQSGDDAWTVMDASGIETTAGSPIRKAWTVRVQRNILSGNPPQPGYVRTLAEYDCDTYRTRWREFSAFSRAGGQLVSRVNSQSDWTPARQAADTYAAYRLVCEPRSGRSVVAADSIAKVVINLMSSWDAAPEPFAPIVRGPAAPDKAAKPAPNIAAAKPAAKP